MKSTIIKRIASIGAALVLVFIVSVFFFNREMGAIDGLVIHNVDISSLDDGEYRGTYCNGRWCYDLTVTVTDHKIAAIVLNDDVMKLFTKLNTILTKKIIAEQKIDLDGISGATITSKAFLKAVENALSKKG